MKKISVLLLSVLLSVPAFSSGFESRMQKSTDSWTQPAPTSARGGSITADDVSQMTDDPDVPVGDTAWVLVLGMGLAYGAYSLMRRRKEA